MSKELDVTIPATYPLSGTLTVPNIERADYPAVLILSGSGKADRDGNLKKMKMNMYKDLADFLTLKGFITLRYDKRGTYKSAGNYLEAGLIDFIDDAANAVKFLQNYPQVDKEKIFILGHSEGALIAPAVNQKASVSGLILLAGAAGPSEELSNWQREHVFAEMNETKGLKGWFFRTLKVPEKARKQNEKIFKKIADSDKAVMRIKGVKMNAKWMRETLDYNVCDYLQEVTCPVLAITGEKDVQVPPEHVKTIAETVKGEAEWHMIPDMNHIFRKYEGNHTMLGLMKEYKTQLHQPIEKEMLKKIEKWLEAHVK